MKDLLLDLVGVFGPSGDESEIKEYITTVVKDCADDIKTDVMGNLIVFKKGVNNEKKIMLAAHMDTIGVMVTYIEDNGYVRFTKIGGIHPETLVEQKVIFKNGTVGVVAFEGKDCTSTGPMEKFYIDLGTSSRQESEEIISIGDTAVFFAPSVELANDVISSPYIDNRASCAVLIQALKELQTCKYDTYFVFTTQEEVGIRGAKTAAFAIMPDIGIAVDVTATGDTINPSRSMAVKLGHGPAIKIKDSSVVCSPMVKDLLVNTAKENGIPYQLELLEFGGTDTSAMQLTGAGVPAGCISIPTRYIHSMSETLSLEDMANATKLLVKVLEA